MAALAKCLECFLQQHVTIYPSLHSGHVKTRQIEKSPDSKVESLYVGVSENRDTPKWMVYTMENSMKNG